MLSGCVLEGVQSFAAGVFWSCFTKQNEAARPLLKNTVQWDGNLLTGSS